MKKLLSFVVAMLFTATSFAQVDDVTITVLGTGVDEERATLQALRSAIEQTFGAFVSANTTILNDSLVQDEIVSVSTGNVKEYKKIAVATLPNGHISVSLTATVSINRLVTYAESKGVKAEFAGSTYAANVKLFRLKIQSIRKAYDLMVQQLEHIAKDMFYFRFEMSEPRRGYTYKDEDIYGFDCRVDVVSNPSSTNFYNLYQKTIGELKLTVEDTEFCKQENIYTCYDFLGNTLPFSYRNEYMYYEVRIKKAIFDACYRYTVQEIGNDKNAYYYRNFSEIPSYEIGHFFSRDKFGSRVEGYGDEYYYLFSALWQAKTSCGTPKFFHGKYSKVLRFEKTLEFDNIINFVGSNLVARHDFCVAIPAERIDEFKGFELVGVSAPIDTLSQKEESKFNEQMENDESQKSEKVTTITETPAVNGIPINSKGDIRERNSTASSRSSTQRQSAYERAVVNRVVNEVYRRSYPSSRSSSSSSRGNMNYQYRSR